jgi:hypothetical protein
MDDFDDFLNSPPEAATKTSTDPVSKPATGGAGDDFLFDDKKSSESLAAAVKGEAIKPNELKTEATVIDASGAAKDVSKPEASVVDKPASSKKKDKGKEKAKAQSPAVVNPVVKDDETILALPAVQLPVIMSEEPKLKVLPAAAAAVKGEAIKPNELKTEATVVDASGAAKDVSKPEASVVDKPGSSKKKDKGKEKAKAQSPAVVNPVVKDDETILALPAVQLPVIMSEEPKLKVLPADVKSVVESSQASVEDVFAEGSENFPVSAPKISDVTPVVNSSGITDDSKSTVAAMVKSESPIVKPVPFDDDDDLFSDVVLKVPQVVDKVALIKDVPKMDAAADNMDLGVDVLKVQTATKITALGVGKNLLSNEDDDFLSDLSAPVVKAPAVIKGDMVTPSKQSVTKVPNTKDDDDFDDLFGDSTPTVKAVTKARAVGAISVSTPAKAAVASTTGALDKVSAPSAVKSSASAPSAVASTVDLNVTAASDPTFSAEFDDLFGSDLTPATKAVKVDSVVDKAAKGLFDEKATVPSVTATTPVSTSTPAPIVGLVSLKESQDDDLDFLSWLGDSTPPVKASASPTSTPAPPAEKKPNASLSLDSQIKNIPLQQPSSTDSGVTSPTQSQSKVKAMMDIFFDDLFGGQQQQAPNATTEREVPLKLKMTSADFERKVEEMVIASFVDVPLLRSLLLEGGYVPSQCRAQVWCLLLTGSCTSFEDPELGDTQRLSTLASELRNHGLLLTDCQAVVNKDNVAAGSMLQEDLQDILILYCTRREREYSSVLCNLLTPLLSAPNPFSKEMASSCFYSLASEFAPLLSLDYASMDTALGTVHSWLRLLVVYHSPAVAQHLDRALPGWELAAALPVSGDHADMETDMNTDATDGTADDRTWSEKGPQKGKEEKWGIPLNWVCGAFSGSLPAEQCCFLLDWAIVSKQRYAGQHHVRCII